MYYYDFIMYKGLSFRTDIRLDTHRFSVSHAELSVLHSCSNTIKRRRYTLNLVER